MEKDLGLDLLPLVSVCACVVGLVGLAVGVLPLLPLGERSLLALGDEVEHGDPPVEDAHEAHVVQEDGEAVRLRGGAVVDLKNGTEVVELS